MQRLSEAFGRILDGLMLAACLLLLAMTRHDRRRCRHPQHRSRRHRLERRGVGEHHLPPDADGRPVAACGRASTSAWTSCCARCRGETAWLLEWAGDILGLACSLYFVWYGWAVLAASYQAGAITIKTLITPEWWMLAPLPGGLPALGHRVPVPHAPPRPRRRGRRAPMRCRRHGGGGHDIRFRWCKGPLPPCGGGTGWGGFQNIGCRESPHP